MWGRAGSDRSACTANKSCETPITLVAVHSLSRSGSSWLMHILSHSPMIYAADRGVNWRVAGSTFRGGVQPDSELFKNAQNWSAIKGQLQHLEHLSSHAYPRPMAASFKIIDDNNRFSRRQNLAKWATFSREHAVINLLLTTYYLLLTTYYLLLTTYYSLFATYYLLLTTHYLGHQLAPHSLLLLTTYYYYLLLTTYYLLLTTYYSLLTTHYSLLAT